MTKVLSISKHRMVSALACSKKSAAAAMFLMERICAPLVDMSPYGTVQNGRYEERKNDSHKEVYFVRWRE